MRYLNPTNYAPRACSGCGKVFGGLSIQKARGEVFQLDFLSILGLAAWPRVGGGKLIWQSKFCIVGFVKFYLTSSFIGAVGA